MSEMPERIWACRWVGSEDGAVRFEHQLWFSQSLQGPNDTEYVRADIVAEKDAEIERLRKALDQVAEMGRMHVSDMNGQPHIWCDERVLPANSMPEAAAYLRERDAVSSTDTRPPDSGVQSGVQEPEEGGQNA